MTNPGEGAVVEQVAQQPIDEVERLRKENEELRKQLEETRQALKSTQDELANLKQNPGTQSGETPSSWSEESASEDVNVNRLYKFGNSSLEQNEVREVLKWLKDPHKSEIRKFIKENQIKEMQDYLNKLIDENVIDKSELKKVCEEKGIRVYENGHILADGKFWPQTMEAVKMLKKVQEEQPQEGEQPQEQQEWNEQLGEMLWLNDLKIEDLGIWDRDWNFIFKDWLIDEESQELILGDDIKLSKLEDGGEWLWYYVTNGRLSIWNFESGVLNWKWIEFYPYWDEYREEERDPNLYWTKLQWEWEGGEFKNGMQTVKEDGLDVHIVVEDWLATKCYLDDESKAFDFENIGDSLYLKNWENDLKLKNRYSAATIMKILYDYKDQEGEFSSDLSEGMRSKKLLRNPSMGEKKVVYWYADNLTESPLQSEGSALAFWLNECRKVEQQEEQQQEEQQQEEQEEQ